MTQQCGLKGRGSLHPNQRCESSQALAAFQAAGMGCLLFPGHRPAASALGWSLPARWAVGRKAKGGAIGINRSGRAFGGAVWPFVEVDGGKVTVLHPGKPPLPPGSYTVEIGGKKATF